MEMVCKFVGAVVISTLLATYLTVAVAVARSMVKDWPEDSWLENVTVGVLWPFLFLKVFYDLGIKGNK